MRALAITTALLAGISAPAFAQSASGPGGSGAIHGQNWTMGQDLSNNRNTAAQPGTLAGDRAARAERQRQHGQNFSGTGRPTSAPQPNSPRAR
ncbi:hypothetical protein [Roseococcus sp.]|uniref:hypothetical protein n=1 Tax=Roseococcus sp. TaxID=2109646 RepID=UPI003BA88378